MAYPEIPTVVTGPTVQVAVTKQRHWREEIDINAQAGDVIRFGGQRIRGGNTITREICQKTVLAEDIKPGKKLIAIFQVRLVEKDIA